MANFYVSTARGSDSTGTGTATNPWKTIGKAIGSSPAMTMSGSGADRLYIEPGTYYESVTLGLTPTSGNTLEILGDHDGGGFYAGGYATPATGIVDWSAWSSDTAALGTACLLGNGKGYVTLRRLKMIGANATVSCLDVGNGPGWTIGDCSFVPNTGYSAVSFGSSAAPAGAGLNATVERCNFYHGGNNAGRSVRILAAEAAAEYSLGTVVRDCRVLGGSGVILSKAASTGLGSLGTGLQVLHCSFMGPNGLYFYQGESITLATPNSVIGCIIHGSTGITAGNTSHVAENYNAFHCMTAPRQNVTAGANSASNLRPALDYEDGQLAGGRLRPFGEPTSGGPYGTAGGPAQTTVDLFGRPRPGGMGSTSSAAGALQRGQAGRKETTTTDGDSASIAIDGPGVHDFQVPIKSGSNSVTIKARYDSNHGSTNKPRVTLMARPECGIASDVAATMTAAAGTWETLTLSYTAAAAGWTWLRLESRSAAGNGVAIFDTYAG